MIKTFRNIAAAFVVALGFALPASATTTIGTDFTDLWWGGGSENGWGLNIIHQNNVIFATLYVYNADGSPRFYSASETRGGGNFYSGPLYDTRGTYYGSIPYNAGAFSATQVGTITLNFSGPNNGTLTYNVGGTTVTKQITRFGFGPNSLGGKYLGGMIATSVCGGVQQNSLIFDTLNVTHNGGSAITMTVDFYNINQIASRCTYNGTYSQQGSLGTVSGTYTCTYGTTGGAQGSFTITEIAPHQAGFNGKFSGSDNFCSSHSGYFGGVRDTAP